MIRFECPHCGKGLRTDDDLAGEAFTCPGCRGRVRVPKPGESAAVRTPARSATLANRFAVKPYQLPPYWSSGRLMRALAAGVFAAAAIGLMVFRDTVSLPNWVTWSMIGIGALVALLMVISVCRLARHPVCSRCHRWKQLSELGSIERDSASAKEALEAGDLAALGALSPEGDRIDVSIAHCPQCGRDAPMEVRFVVRAANDKQSPSKLELAHVTYPGAALPTFQRLCSNQHE